MLGKVHGLHGELYLNVGPGGTDYLRLGERFYLAPASATEADELVPCTVTRVGGTDERPLIRLDLSASREQAVAIQGSELLAGGGELDDLPQYTYGELIGLPLETAGGQLVGTISNVVQAPAHELLEVSTPGGRTLLVPLVDALITLDAAAGIVRVSDGLLDDELEH